MANVLGAVVNYMKGRRLYNYLARNHSQLGPYLAGLWEGDGHISFGDGYPDFAISFHIKDKPLAYKLQSLTGLGNIRDKSLEKHATDSVV